MAEYVDMEMNTYAKELLKILRDRENRADVHVKISALMRVVERKYKDTWVTNPMSHVLSSMSSVMLIEKCEKCGENPCFPWADEHDDDFAKEIEEHESKTD